MVLGGNEVVPAPSDLGEKGGGNCRKRKALGVARPGRWGVDNSRWGELKYHQRRRFVSFEEAFPKQSGWPKPPTNIVPHRDWQTGILHWDLSDFRGSWRAHTPIACPDFPEVLDEDVFQLLCAFGRQEQYTRRLLGPDNDLYRWAIVTASKGAIDGLSV
jgi:hypothetical protein